MEASARLSLLGRDVEVRCKTRALCICVSLIQEGSGSYFVHEVSDPHVVNQRLEIVLRTSLAVLRHLQYHPSSSGTYLTPERLPLNPIASPPGPNATYGTMPAAPPHPYPTGATHIVQPEHAVLRRGRPVATNMQAAVQSARVVRRISKNPVGVVEALGPGPQAHKVKQ